MHMPQHQTVIDALCQTVSRYLPPALQSVLDELIERLQQQRVNASSNREEQVLIDFLRACKSLRDVVHVEAVANICQHLRQQAPLTTPPSDLSEWNLVDDAEVEIMLDTRRLARGLREPLSNLEWRVCNCLEQFDSSLSTTCKPACVCSSNLRLSASCSITAASTCWVMACRTICRSWMGYLLSSRLCRGAPHWSWLTRHRGGSIVRRQRSILPIAVTKPSSN